MSMTTLFNQALLAEAAYANFWNSSDGTVIKDSDRVSSVLKAAGPSGNLGTLKTGNSGTLKT